MSKKRRKKNRARVIRIRRLNNQLLCVVLGDKFKHRGHDLAGFRVVRVTGAMYDRKRKQVVKVAARLYGGDPDRFGGWNGPKVVINDRRHFAGSHSLGVSRGKEVVSVDAFVRRPKEQRGVPEMIKTGNRTRPRPVEATESISRGPSTPPTPQIAPASSQAAQRGHKSGRKPRSRPPATMAPPFKDEPAIDPAPEYPDELASEGPDLTPDETAEIDDFSDGPDVTDAEYDQEVAAEAEAQLEEPDVTHPKDCDNVWHKLPAANRKLCACPTCKMTHDQVPPSEKRPPLVKTLKTGRAVPKSSNVPDPGFQEDPAPAGKHLEPADTFKEIPPLLDRIWDVKVDVKLVAELGALLKRKPSLLKPASSIGEPSWNVTCPDKDVLHFAGYGYKYGRDPIQAEVLCLTAYQEPPAKSGMSGTQYGGSTMPAGKVTKAIKALLAHQVKAEEPDVEIEPRKKGPPKTKPPENPDDYFS